MTGVRIRGRAYSASSPLLRRAQPSRRGPAETDSKAPSLPTQSSESVRGDRPLSVAAMIAGQASSVDLNRPSTLLDGISRSWYATAPSMKISVFSPGRLAKGLGRHSTVERSISGISRSSSSIGVRIAFALRGAPCGDDPRPLAGHRDYHDEQSTFARPTDNTPADVSVADSIVCGPHRERARNNGVCLLECDAVLTDIGARLTRLPLVLRHRGTVAMAAYPGLTPC